MVAAHLCAAHRGCAHWAQALNYLLLLAIFFLLSLLTCPYVLQIFDYLRLMLISISSPKVIPNECVAFGLDLTYSPYQLVLRKLALQFFYYYDYLYPCLTAYICLPGLLSARSQLTPSGFQSVVY
jgi:hypothetical protein